MAQSSDDRFEMKEIRDFLRQIRDIPEDASEAISFITMMKNRRGQIQPFAEAITVLKYEKPILYQQLKHMVSPTSQLHFILHLDMDLAVAMERLGLKK